MFVTADPAGMALSAGLIALLSAAQAAADGAHAAVHGALIPPAADPTAIAATALHHFDHANYQLQAGLGTANEAAISGGLGISGVSYALTDFTGSGLLG